MTVAQELGVVAAIVILVVVWLVLRERQRWRRVRFGFFIEREDDEQHRLTEDEFHRWLLGYFEQNPLEGRLDDPEGDA